MLLEQNKCHAYTSVHAKIRLYWCIYQTGKHFQTTSIETDRLVYFNSVRIFPDNFVHSIRVIPWCWSATVNTGNKKHPCRTHESTLKEYTRLTCLQDYYLLRSGKLQGLFCIALVFTAVAVAGGSERTLEPSWNRFAKAGWEALWNSSTGFHIPPCDTTHWQL